MGFIAGKTAETGARVSDLEAQVKELEKRLEALEKHLKPQMPALITVPVDDPQYVTTRWRRPRKS